ncbi:glutathione S-transferase family protein [Altererythrobacter aurantiacus]|uniref:Glutathione S-transferase family protein n=1 Tax=Parapontixanthobacter aurantiacus TaxID=1463599 RepID=A0A844ZHV7_9SPHN|nr:glutathione S-transferase family protein [Parapontixanthobacter aurantiacus]MXO86527.1 glutathione S-transferase family protein [Parapontixanthobacter aurantiacus]
MGFLKDGVWHDEWDHNDEDTGAFERDESAFRNWVTPDGSAGPTGDGDFRAEPGRYRLYISLACPWAHRANVARHLKGLTGIIDLAVVHWLMVDGGWSFRDGSCVTKEPEIDADFLHQLYTHAKPDYSGHVTVPVLWDTKRKTIVNNESADILRMFGSAFDDCGANDLDLYPEGLRDEIDRLNERVYDTVNNGVYKAGFATTQEAYDEAVGPLFDMLDELEGRLNGKEWLVGDRLTEADIRLWTTLIRFDPVYYVHFKCNVRRIRDYPNLAAFTQRLLALDGVEETVNFEHIRRHYYESHKQLNPNGIVPAGPEPLVPEPAQ